MVLDGAGWHSSRLLKPPQNMKLLPLPPYAHELNPVEHVWDELREKHFHNRVFDSLDALEDQLEVACTPSRTMRQWSSPLWPGNGLLVLY